MTLFSESSLPALIFSVPAGHPKGDVPALGRLTVNEAQGADQWWAIWGVETNDLYTHTDSSGSGALFYEAESRTAQGGAAVASASGVNASPAGSTTNNIVRHTSLNTEYLSLLSTQASGAGSHLSHVGQFRVFLRCRTSNLTSSETVSVLLEWGYGDYRTFTRNDERTIPSTDLAQWRLLDMGIVSIPQLIGTQRWEGRFLAKSTVAGTDFDLDCFILVPIDIASGEASGLSRSSTPTAFLAFDGFNQTSGALTGKTAETGGTWVGAGDTDDFSVSGSGDVTRAAASDAANTGRWSTLDINQTGIYVQSYIYWTIGSGTAPTMKQGVIARYADTNNWVAAWLRRDGSAVWYLEIVKRVAGTITTLQSVSGLSLSATQSSSTPGSLSFTVDTNGRYTATLDASPELRTITGQDSALATGGALATGDIGIYGENTSAFTPTLGFLSIQGAAYITDAAMFASQSLEVRHDRVIREDSSGVLWQPVSSYEGDFNRVPVTGREGRSVRYIVKASRNDPATSADPNIDDITATLAVTPRYLSVPAPS